MIKKIPPRRLKNRDRFLFGEGFPISVPAMHASQNSDGIHPIRSEFSRGTAVHKTKNNATTQTSMILSDLSPRNQIRGAVVFGNFRVCVQGLILAGILFFFSQRLQD